jgi:hypothetical protein
MFWKKLLSFSLLVSTIVLLFYLMWALSRDYPFELSLHTHDGLYSPATFYVPLRAANKQELKNLYALAAFDTFDQPQRSLPSRTRAICCGHFQPHS